MSAPLPRSKWRSVPCQKGLHEECDGVVLWVREETKNRCPCACHAVTGEGDS